MAIEIVDFPMKNGGSFHSKLLVYQRVMCIKKPRKTTLILDLQILRTRILQFTDMHGAYWLADVPGLTIPILHCSQTGTVAPLTVYMGVS